MMTEKRVSRGRLAVLAVVVTGLMASLLAVLNMQSASAATISPAVYPTDGARGTWTHAQSGPVVAVNDIVTIDNTVFVGGAFAAVWDRNTNGSRGNPYLAAYDASTGKWIDWFRPRLDGVVHALAVTPEGNLMVAGEFQSVDGHADTQGIAVLDPSTGAIIPTFASNIVRGGRPEPAVVREIRIAGPWAYVAGSFSRVRGGTPGGVVSAVGVQHAARINWKTGQPDTAWRPDVRGRGLWAIEPLPDNSRVFLGGNHESVAGVANTYALAAVDGTVGNPIPGWQGGLPWPLYSAWGPAGGVAYGLAVYGQRLYIGGAEHRWATKRTTDGATLQVVETTNDTQRVDRFGDYIYIGCHCVGDGFYYRKIHAPTGQNMENVSANVRGGDGGWALAEAPDECLWFGGAFDRATSVVGGGTTTLANLVKVCPTNGPKAHSFKPVPNNMKQDVSPPTAPKWASGTVNPNGNKLILNWAESTDDSGVVSYKVYRNNVLIAETRQRRFEDTVVSGNHTWAVVAFDAAGRASASAAWNMGTGFPAPAAPPAVRNLAGASPLGVPTVTWTRDPDPEVGYIVRRNGTEVGRVNGYSSVMHRSATQANTVARDGSNLAALFDQSVWRGATSANAHVTVDLGESIWIDHVAFRGLSATSRVYFSDQPFTTWDMTTLGRTPGVSSLPLAPGGAGATTLVTANLRARYVRVTGSSTLTAREFILMSRWGHRTASYSDHAAPEGQHTYEVLAYRPHESVSPASSVRLRAIAAGQFVELTSPTEGAVFETGRPATLSASVTASRMNTRRVEYLVDGKVVATSTAAPWAAQWTPSSEGDITVVARATSDTGQSDDSQPVTARVVCGSGTEAGPDGFCRVWSRGHIVVNQTNAETFLVSRDKDDQYLTPALTPARGTTAAAAERPDERLTMVSVNSSATSWDQQGVASANWGTGTALGGTLVDGSLVTRPNGSQVYLLTNGGTLFHRVRSAAGAWNGAYTSIRAASGNRVDGTFDAEGRVVFGFLDGGVARTITETARGSNTFTTTPVNIGGSSLRDLSLMTDAEGIVNAFLATSTGVLRSRLVDGAWTAPASIGELVGATDRISAELVDGLPLVAIVRGGRVLVSRWDTENGEFPEPTVPMATSTARDVDVVSNRIGGAAESLTVKLTKPEAGLSVFSGTAVALEATTSASRARVDRVEFLVNGRVVGTSTTAPYQVSWTPNSQGDVSVVARAVATTTWGTALTAEDERTVTAVCRPGTEPSPDGTCRVWSRGYLIVNQTTNDVLTVARTTEGSFLPAQMTPAKGTTAVGAELLDETLSMVSVNSSATYFREQGVATGNWNAGFGLGGALVDGSLLTRPNGAQMYLLTNGSSLYHRTRSAAGHWDAGYTLIRAASGNRVDGTIDANGRVVFGYIDGGVARVITETSPGAHTYTTTPVAIGGASLRDLSLVTEDGVVTAYLVQADGVLVSRLVGTTWTAPVAIPSLAGPTDRISAEIVDGRTLIAIVRGSRALTSHVAADGTVPGPVPALDATNVRDVDVVSNRIGGVEPAVAVAVTAPTAGTNITAGTNVTLTASVSTTRTAVQKVDFFVDGTLVGSRTASPWSVAWTASGVGTRNITARVTGAPATGGTSTTDSAPVGINVLAVCLTGVTLGVGEFCGRATFTTELPQFGGNGGNPAGPFDCPSGQVLTGLRVYEAGQSTGWDINQVAGLCGVPVVNGSTVRIASINSVAGPMGSASGTLFTRSCPANQVVAGVDAGLTSSGFPDWFRLRCTALTWDTAGNRFLRTGLTDDTATVSPVDVANGRLFDNQDCANNDVLIGFRGRLGSTMDAIQFRCGALSPR